TRAYQSDPPSQQPSTSPVVFTARRSFDQTQEEEKMRKRPAKTLTGPIISVSRVCDSSPNHRRCFAALASGHQVRLEGLSPLSRRCAPRFTPELAPASSLVCRQVSI